MKRGIILLFVFSFTLVLISMSFVSAEELLEGKCIYDGDCARYQNQIYGGEFIATSWTCQKLIPDKLSKEFEEPAEIMIRQLAKPVPGETEQYYFYNAEVPFTFVWSIIYQGEPKIQGDAIIYNPCSIFSVVSLHIKIKIEDIDIDPLYGAPEFGDKRQILDLIDNEAKRNLKTLIESKFSDREIEPTCKLQPIENLKKQISEDDEGYQYWTWPIDEATCLDNELLTDYPCTFPIAYVQGTCYFCSDGDSDVKGRIDFPSVFIPSATTRFSIDLDGKKKIIEEKTEECLGSSISETYCDDKAVIKRGWEDCGVGYICENRACIHASDYSTSVSDIRTYRSNPNSDTLAAALSSLNNWIFA